MAQRSYRGRIDYIRDNSGVKGREFFSVTVQDDGMRTIRAQCEMDDIGLLRDVEQTVDANWMPVDALVRLTQEGEFMGGGWFRFDATGVECEAFTRNEGRISQRVETGTPIRIFASHPLLTDGWQTRSFDHGGDKRQTVRPRANSSPRPDGGSRPMFGMGQKVIDYVGKETLTVPAGTFPCRSYYLHASNPTAPPLKTWVTGEDATPAKMRWDLLKSDYVLTELTGETL